MLPPTLGRSSTAPPPALLSYQDLLLPAAFNISYSSDGKSICLQCRRPGFDPWVGKIPWRRKWQPTPVFLPGKSHGWQSLVGYCSWGRKESDVTEQLHFHVHALLSGRKGSGRDFFQLLMLDGLFLSSQTYPYAKAARLGVHIV